jgi:hypothetical protein
MRKNNNITEKAVEVNADELANSLGEEVLSRLNQDRINAAEENLMSAKRKLSTKVYAVQFENADQIEQYTNFMANEAQWREKEALGVIEICKVIDELKKDGIKNNILYMQALPLEASHYFISKQSGKGLKEAKDFIQLLKPFEQALESAKSDAREIQDLERELAAAQQGIDLA